MADDLDNLLRAAMKTLDEQVPSGYFDALPNQTLARLEGSMQQQGSSGSTTENLENVAPPVLASTEPDTTLVARQPSQERDEDSGLHDIRNLAQSTKQRLSSKRHSTSPPISDDVLASASGSFKNIALPQPAKMVSLPEIDELPSKADVAAAEKAAKKVAKEKKAEPAAPIAAATSTAVTTPATPSIERKAFTLPSQQRKGGKGPLLAVVGLGLAAAAGGVIFMQVSKQDQAAPQTAAAEPPTLAAPAAAPAAPAAGSGITAEPIAAPEPAAVEPPAEEAPVAAAQIAADDKADDDKAEAKASKKSKSSRGGKAKLAVEEPKDEAPAKTETKKPAAAKGGDGEGEPSFDALLKEAGVAEKKEAKPALDKKSLTGDDFKKGIGQVVPKAKGCYKGTQGTAMVKLTVAPSGSISKVKVTGEFAGKPEASCIESAIKAATFPPWDGGPQSFTYSVLLSD